jgi:hypothetical protein
VCFEGINFTLTPIIFYNVTQNKEKRKIMPYPLVHISNSTVHYVSGIVYYAGCRNDDYHMDANSEWTAKSRGVCLLTEISAEVDEDGKKVRATPYTSSGTSYSQFAVIKIHDGYAVTRIT